jgi:hypothetical protein
MANTIDLTQDTLWRSYEGAGKAYRRMTRLRLGIETELVCRYSQERLQCWYDTCTEQDRRFQDLHNLRRALFTNHR